MSASAIDRSVARDRRGSALVGTLVVGVCLTGLVLAGSMISKVELRESRRGIDQVRARYVAEAGFEAAMGLMRDAVRKTAAYDPLGGLANFVANAEDGIVLQHEALLDGDAAVGEYTVALQVLERDTQQITLSVVSTGYLPAAPANLAPGQRLEAWESQAVTVRYELAPSKVFDYAYFINNWGWFYGDSIIANGNARSNGQFDSANYRPWCTGQPLYEGLEWTGGVPHLLGYQDDNGDGLTDGNDGGIFAGWDIVRSQNVRGNGGRAQNQHPFQERIEMPNLSHLEVSEAEARAANGSIRIGGTTVSNAVYGDEAGERQNLYLVGTVLTPIQLDGPVVVRGDVVISGVVTGQGAIYSGRNVYCPQSVTYLHAPRSVRPTDNTQTATEAWLQANQDADFLGLFARENIVVGDFTNSTWRSYVSSWMNQSMNESREDCGEDQIPNTRAGRDGVSGTADDDVLEGDGVFTTDYYTEMDAALGLVPPGFSVGDRIPGSGEDIDGDGQYDDRITLNDLQLSGRLDQAHWGGNMPVTGIASYNLISTLYANRLDAVLYTNHSFCWVVLGALNAQVNGSLVCRNEDIIYGTPEVQFNYDCRLLGDLDGIAGPLLPKTVRPARILSWERLDRDPNHYVGAHAEEADGGILEE